MVYRTLQNKNVKFPHTKMTELLLLGLLLK